MKIGYRILFWILSVVFLFLAFAFIFSNLLSGALMLAAAVIVNPLFIKGVHLKKGLTALLVIGFFLASVAVLPGEKGESQTRTAVGSGQATQKAGDDLLSEKTSRSGLSSDLTVTGSLASVAKSEVPSAEENTPTPTLTITPSPALVSTPAPTDTPAPTPTPTAKATTTPIPTEKPTPSPTAIAKTTPTPIPTVKPTSSPAPAAARSRAQVSKSSIIPT